MWKQRLSKVVLKIIEKGFSLLTKPFAEAGSLESYSTRGYLLLGLILANPVFFLWWRGILSTPLSQSNPVVRGIYKALAEKSVVLSYIPDSYISLLFLPALIYILLFLWPSKYRLIGEATANFCFWFLNKVINIGEWCIEHRWSSFFLIVFLSFILALLISYEIREFSDDRRLHNDFDYWLKDVENFVEYNPVTKPENERYARVKSYWRDDFNKILELRDGSTHPALCLNEMLNDLYSEQTDKSWNDTLLLKANHLNEIMSRCSPRPRSKMDLSELRTWALMNILMGRIYVRLSETPDNQNYSNYQELVKALNYFKEVEELPYRTPADLRPYKSDAINGKGTVYGNAFSAYTRGRASAPITPDQVANLKLICMNPSQCALQAINAYEEAGKEFGGCSFQGKRRLNNTTDLLLRIGQHYDDVAKELTVQPFEKWTRTPLTLADEIEHRTQELMACNSSEPFLSTFALTAAQGFGVCAKLRLQAGQDATNDILAAGHYLRLANSFEPVNVPKWDYSYFCFAVTQEGLNQNFRDAISSTHDGLPNADRLLEIIQRSCR